MFIINLFAIKPWSYTCVYLTYVTRAVVWPRASASDAQCMCTIRVSLCLVIHIFISISKLNLNGKLNYSMMHQIQTCWCHQHIITNFTSLVALIISFIFWINKTGAKIPHRVAQSFARNIEDSASTNDTNIYIL